MGELFSIIIFGAAFIFFFFGVFLSIRNYEFTYKSKYSLLNSFPFEVNYGGNFFDNLFGNVALVLSFIFLIVFYATFDGSHSNGMAIFALISGILLSVFSAFIFFVPFKNLKTHIALSTFSFAFSFTLAASIFLLNMFYYEQNDNILNLVAAIIEGIVGLVILASVLNPKLSLRIEGREETLPNGEVKITRPKLIPYALTEWIIVFTLFIDAIGIILYLISVR